MFFFKDKRVLITGVCGTVGSELARLLLGDNGYGPGEVVGIDNNESELFFLDQKYVEDDRAKFFLTSVRDKDKLNRVMQGIDIVFHAAALKHVVLCERSPFEAVQTNIHGIQNLIYSARQNNVERVIFTSSDKAVNPTNVMGTSKLMGERIITAANSNSRGEGTIFSSTRFGNVLGSSGSVIPIFHKQIAGGGPVTLTHPEMTRFIMTISDSVRLVIDSAELAKGGEVFITKMQVIRIKELAAAMVDILAPKYGHVPGKIDIKEIGTKPGEKLYEELMSDEEIRRAVELERYFAVLPAFRGFYRDIDYRYSHQVSDKVNNPYISRDEPKLTKEELKGYLIKHKLLTQLDINQHTPDQRYWPGDK